MLPRLLASRGSRKAPPASPASPKPLEVTKATAEDLFRAELNPTQLQELDNWRDIGGGWTGVKIPVWGAKSLWHIRLMKYRSNNHMICQLVRNESPLCFHALDANNNSLNQTDPYVSALAFLCMIKTSEGFIRQPPYPGGAGYGF